MIRTIETTPFFDQKMGTSGLRKKVFVFQQSHYTENFVQSIFDSQSDFINGILVLGGDGRFLNHEILIKIISMAAANGFSRVMVGKNGILSTPAASHIIQKYKASGGLILSASHNPAGAEGDFGIKYNVHNGGPAPENLTNFIFEKTKTIKTYKILDDNKISIDKIGTFTLQKTKVDVFDPIQDYAELMETLFDFKAIRNLFAKGFRMIFDSMHAVTGPYATEILEKRLGLSSDCLRNNEILSDFGGKHPNPDPIHAAELYHTMMQPCAPDFGAASDGDGDRNMIMGRGIFVKPSDSLAILAANAHLVPAWKKGIKGIARSMPTSRAADQVAKKLGIPLYETPTGWKFFNNLLISGKITICGEESAGTGANHIAEKDGLWAVLFWLNILAVRGETVTEIVKQHWETYGRNYHTRHDYEDVESAKVDACMEALFSSLSSLCGKKIRGMTITNADSFTYHDPVDGSVSTNQGIRIFFDNVSRIIFRVSGTGTSGKTLRVYLEKFEENSLHFSIKTQEVLSDLIFCANKIADIKNFLGRENPDLIT